MINTRHVERVATGKNPKRVTALERTDTDGARSFVSVVCCTLISLFASFAPTIFDHGECVNGFEGCAFSFHGVLAFCHKAKKPREAAADNRHQDNGDATGEADLKILR
jgi:hypothetical protein